MKNDGYTIEQCGAHLDLSDRSTVLTDIANRIATGLGLQSATPILKALEKRESTGSTGLEKGVALPHCALPDADRFVAGLITLKEPIDFGAIDGQPSDIFLFVGGPEERRSDHVRILAALTTQLRQEEVRERVRQATSGTELAQILTSGMGTVQTDETGPFSILVIYVQDEARYEPILEAVSGEPDASVSVSEAKSAGSILHRLPLFATFWNEQESRDVHRIEVTLPRERVNRTIRRIEEISGEKNGVQISALDLSYGSGQLDL